MKTLGTKIDNNLADRFRNVCNNEGKTISQQLRDMIEEWCVVCEDEKEEPKITITDVDDKPKPIAQGKILDYNGNVIGTF